MPIADLTDRLRVMTKAERLTDTAVQLHCSRSQVSN